MFAPPVGRMLASMSEIDPRMDTPLVDWSDLGVNGLLPTGTVTLLLADVEGSTRLWEPQPEQMTAAFARLDQTLLDLLAAYGGVRPVEQGEGDSFVVAFAQAALAGGSLKVARCWADDAVATAEGSHRVVVLTTSARVAIAEGQPARAERDAHDALARAADLGTHLFIPDILECLGALAGDAGSHSEAARLFGAAHSSRQSMGTIRFKVWDADYEASVASLREALGEADFDAACAEGAALSADEAIAYVQRGRGERKRPASGWASLTPAERDVVRLVSEGLGNNDIATRLFVSPRTVQSHLTHVYAKLGLTSRVQLAQQAARHTKY
jgi:DNA-binding CsgD family transcriptional regulator